MAIAEQSPVVALTFGFGNEPCPGSHRIEVLDKNFGIESLLLLRVERMRLEFRDDFFCKQLHNINILHCRNARTAKDDKARAENLPYSVSYAYDHAGRVLSKTDVFGNAATYSYNDAGNLINIHEAAGKTVSYSYDALGRNTIAYDGSMFSKNYYDDNGNLVKTTESQTANASNGHATTMTYDDLTA